MSGIQQGLYTAKYRTVCKNCGGSIYTNHAAHWQSGDGKPVGLVHDDCQHPIPEEPPRKSRRR